MTTQDYILIGICLIVCIQLGIINLKHFFRFAPDGYASDEDEYEPYKRKARRRHRRSRSPSPSPSPSGSESDSSQTFMTPIDKLSKMTMRGQNLLNDPASVQKQITEELGTTPGSGQLTGVSM